MERERTSAAREVLVAGLGELAIPASEAQLEALLRLALTLEAWAGRMNLTAHRTAEAVARRLILDAAALASQLPPLDSLADLGSGAGFPGLPIAILRPGCSVTLVEARERRHFFQRAAIRAIGLDNAHPVLGRAEELGASPHAAAVAQALARPARALSWMRRWVRPGGLLVLPGAERFPEVPESPGVSLQRRVRYRVPCGGPSRTLWIGRCGPFEPRDSAGKNASSRA